MLQILVQLYELLEEKGRQSSMVGEEVARPLPCELAEEYLSLNRSASKSAALLEDFKQDHKTVLRRVSSLLST